MIEVEDTRPFSTSNQLLQQRFSFQERQRSQVFSIQEQQIKCDEHALPPMEEQISKDRTSSFVDTCNFAIQYCAFCAKVLRDPLSKIRESAKGVSISRNQFAIAFIDVGERSETVDLQFEDVMVGIERLRTA